MYSQLSEARTAERHVLQKLRAPKTNLSVAVQWLERSLESNSVEHNDSHKRQCDTGPTLGLRNRAAAAHLHLSRALYRRNLPGDRQRAHELYARATQLNYAASADAQVGDKSAEIEKAKKHRECAEERVDSREFTRGLDYVPS